MELNLYKEYLQEKGKSENTISSYLSDLKLFMNWTNINIEELKGDEVIKYRDYLQSLSYSISTINRKMVSLRSYIDYLNQEKNLRLNLKIENLNRASQNFIDDALSNNEVKRIIGAATRDLKVPKRAEKAYRTIAVIYTLFYTGARISEALQIKKKDINKDSIMVCGKGNKYREILIPKKLKHVLKEYVSRNSDISSPLIFTGQRGKITRSTAWADIKEYTGKARGISKDKVHPHAFRHLYAKNLSSLKVHPVIISQLLGHSLNVTGLYMQASKKELLKVINEIDINRVEDLETILY